MDDFRQSKLIQQCGHGEFDAALGARHRAQRFSIRQFDTLIALGAGDVFDFFADEFDDQTPTLLSDHSSFPRE
jgi:hypothetical protein